MVMISARCKCAGREQFVNFVEKNFLIRKANFSRRKSFFFQNTNGDFYFSRHRT